MLAAIAADKYAHSRYWLSMGARAAIWAIALAALVSSWPGAAFADPAIPTGREAQVLALVKRALAAQNEQPKYNVRIDREAIRVQISEPEQIELVVHASGPSTSELAPGVELECGDVACSDTQRSRWRGLAKALAVERDAHRGELWTEVQPDPSAQTPSTPPRILWGLVALFGMGWTALYAFRCLTVADWRERRGEFLTIATLCVTSALVALGLTAHLPVHEHNSYLARADCAWMLTCTEDPAGPGWVPAFFRVYGPLLHAFPYSVANLCRFTLILALLACLLARHWLVVSLIAGGWSPRAARNAGLWALAFTCLNPLWIRVAVAGTPWPYVALCLFAAGLAATQAMGGAGKWRFVAGAASSCLLALAINSNLVMLTALPLVWLGPALSRADKRWWLPSAWQIAAAMFCLALSMESLELFREVILEGANPRAEFTLYHLFFDPRFLPPTLGLLLLLGLIVALRRRGPLMALVYVALVTHPALTNYAGAPLGPTYPVSLINAFLGQSCGALIGAVGLGWLIERASHFGRRRLASLAALVALLIPAAFAKEGWLFLTGSRVAERELSAISRALPNLPPHTQLFIPSRIQRQPPGVEPVGDPLELRFPAGEYLASERRLGRAPPPPIPLEETSRAGTPAIDSPQTLVYVGVSQRSFFPTEVQAGAVPTSLRRSELEALYEDFTLVAVSTFELTPEQHPAIPWRLGAGRAAKVELGFYWLQPKAR